jgi:hypothetical protein
VFRKSLTIIGLSSFGNVMSIRRTIDLLDGVSCITKECEVLGIIDRSRC